MRPCVLAREAVHWMYVIDSISVYPVQSRFTFSSSALWFVLSTLMGIQEWGSPWILFSRQLLGVTLGKQDICILHVSYCSHAGLLSLPGTHRTASALPSAGTLFSQIAPWPTLSLLQVFVQTVASQWCLFWPNCNCPPLPCPQIPPCSVPFFPHGTDTLCYCTVCSFMIVLYSVFLSTVLWTMWGRESMLVLFMVHPKVLEQQVLNTYFLMNLLELWVWRLSYSTLISQEVDKEDGQWNEQYSNQGRNDLRNPWFWK